MKKNETQELPWDVFISYASEDRKPFVISLVKSLRQLGLSVWYDEFRISVGESLREAIDNGIKGSRYGVVVLSQNFFREIWTNRELDGLLTQERPDQKTLFPIWHNVDEIGVRNFSPIVASRVALRSSLGADKIASEINKKVKKSFNVSLQGYGGWTRIVIMEDDGIVWVYNGPSANEDFKEAKILDFAGRELDIFEEKSRFEEFFNQSKSLEGRMFEFNERIGVVQINEAICTQKDIDDGAIVDGKHFDLPIPFLPLFVCHSYTFGICNKSIMDAAADFEKRKKKEKSNR